MAIKGILFDKDGTLLDFDATWSPVLQQAATVIAGRDPVLARLLLTIGGFEVETGRTAPNSLLAAGNTVEIAEAWAEQLPGSDPAVLIEELDRIFQEGGVINAVPVTDLEPLFRRLKARGLSLGLATSDSQAAAEATLGRFALLQHMDFIAGYDSGHGYKPEPGMFHAFCKACDILPGEVVMVGDNNHDLKMGQAAGAAALIGVLTGSGTPEQLSLLTGDILGSIAELEAWLEAREAAA
ncbi:MAG: HAD family hydrolase [Rhodovibrionaceae bacterium]